LRLKFYYTLKSIVLIRIESTTRDLFLVNQPYGTGYLVTVPVLVPGTWYSTLLVPVPRQGAWSSEPFHLFRDLTRLTLATGL
jgi:hypothetical protein